MDDDLFAAISPDESVVSDVGAWAVEKHKLLAHYATLFARSMKGKWDELIYLDLFSGPGRCRFDNSNRIYRSSPTIVLGLADEFDSYIFCDSDPENADALRARVAKDAPRRRVAVFSHDANANVEEILRLIPKGSSRRRVLSFCFLDPYRMSDLRFSTIRRLSERYVDFLVLIPSGMDANRNERIYTRDDNHVLDDFLGDASWRERWTSQTRGEERFEQFVVQEFGRSMSGLRYIVPEMQNIATIRSHEKNLLLYRLALYSRHPLGEKFWKQSRKYADPQIGMEF